MIEGDRTTRVFLVDDHAIMREGLRSLLAAEPDMLVVGEACDGLEAVQKVDEAPPDIVVMDVVMPRMNGLEATRQIKKRHPDVQVIVLSMYDDEEYVRQMIQAGAAGYVLKNGASADLARAIREANQGCSYLYPSIAAKVIEDYMRRVTGGDRANDDGQLTAREREVLKLITEGRSSHAIARDLSLSVKTVQTHRANIMRKLNIHDVTELVKYALRKGFIRLD
jgi:DNA-binding NarL/FixJ family response regulator